MLIKSVVIRPTVIIIGIQPLGQFGQRPELTQVNEAYSVNI